MGYTHYWQNPGFTQDEWTEVRKFAKRIVAETDVPIQFEDDIATAPQIDNEVIRFNGVGDAAHETFYLAKQPSSSFQFCKTARKPYDEVVVAMLIMLSTVNPIFSWSSDGQPADHVDGLSLFGRTS